MSWRTGGELDFTSAKKRVLSSFFWKRAISSFVFHFSTFDGDMVSV